MPKRPKGGKGQPRSDEPAKYSVLVPPEIDRKIDEICKLRHISLSLLLREILEENLEIYRLRALGETPDKLPAEMGGALLIHPTEDTRRLLSETAMGLNMTADQVVQLLLRRHLPTLYEESVQLREQFANLLKRGPAPPKQLDGPHDESR